MYRTIIVMTFLLACIGCAHTQLGYQTVHQAHTVADVHTQQVLDNLAKFVHNPNALPHFSYPTQGSSEVNGSMGGTVGFNFLPSSLQNWNIGANGNRGMRENYTMTPINDPRKLELMRCAYQRAIAACCGGGDSNHCPNCDKRFNQFYLGTASPTPTQETFLGWNVFTYGDGKKKVFAVIPPPSVDEPNRDDIVYYDKESGQVVKDPTNLVPSIIKNNLATHTEKTGKITSECLYSPCWFYVGCKKDIPKCCAHVGEYCGTYVWVPESGVDQLTKLTITILDYAFYDAAKLSRPPTKVVEYYLDGRGNPTKKDDAIYKVMAQVGVNDDVRALNQTQNDILALRAERVEDIKAQRVRMGTNDSTIQELNEMSLPELGPRQDLYQPPTRTPFPSLLEFDQQLRNVAPIPAR
ncbi:hypothetical protein Pan97_14680 [Bremerella volcania]|uniref:Uncharacterized protein n=1 Tax=Bremerella volcania TaxID=2527984 RepID=A0A518C5F2_9BACT|nr:hypothetical protein [Bremerella volcania]QDU74460.1 hypothetical protein Pan97_14680 [Bremerella volcania]